LTKDDIDTLLADPSQVGDTLNASFPLRDRLLSAWRVFRYPHTLRNMLHFVQEARTALEEGLAEQPGGIVVTPSWMTADLASDALQECGKAEHLIKFISNYEGED